MKAKINYTEWGAYVSMWVDDESKIFIRDEFNSFECSFESENLMRFKDMLENIQDEFWGYDIDDIDDDDYDEYQDGELENIDEILLVEYYDYINSNYFILGRAWAVLECVDKYLSRYSDDYNYKSLKDLLKELKEKRKTNDSKCNV